jgi:N-acylneuraminate cytidylyltransferase
MIAGKSVLGLIAARGGSKGVPGKNIIPVNGRPLIQWSIDAARGSRYIDRLILSSDDPAIMDVARSAGCEVPFQRDPELAGDNSSSIEVVADALRRVPGYDIVVLLQPTSPLRITADIDGAIEMLVSSGANACVSVCEADEHPYWMFRRGPDGRLSHFVEAAGQMPLRRQDLPTAWSLNGAVYAAASGWLLKNMTFLSGETVGYPMPAERSIDIDTYEDLQLLQSILRDKDNATLPASP